jgi:hypothetical protein
MGTESKPEKMGDRLFDPTPGVQRGGTPPPDDGGASGGPDPRTREKTPGVLDGVMSELGKADVNGRKGGRP